jgi:hypothetical protein
MIQRTPKTVYVSPQQLQRQLEHRDEARKAIVPILISRVRLQRHGELASC